MGQEGELSPSDGGGRCLWKSVNEEALAPSLAPCRTWALSSPPPPSPLSKRDTPKRNAAIFLGVSHY